MKTQNFLTFQTYSDPELAQTIAGILQEHQLEVKIENSRGHWDPSFAQNEFGAEIFLKIRANDFTRAQQILESHYQQGLDEVEDDYYLLDFTNDELENIIARPDEWGTFDYQLAKKLLKDRGKEVRPETVAQLKAERINELAKPEHTHRFWIVFGYLSAVLGGVFGLVIGWGLAHSKKTLPNGNRVHTYSPTEREHGTRMFWMSVVSVLMWGIWKWRQ